MPAPAASRPPERRTARFLARGGDTVAGGASVALGSQIVIYTLGLAGSIMIARALGPAGRGVYYLPVTAAMIAVALLHLSVETANTYLHAERKTPLDVLVRSSTTIALALSPLCVGGMLAVYALERDGLFADVPFAAFLAVTLAVPLQIHLLWLANVFLLGRRLPRSQLASVVGAVVQVAGTTVLFVLGSLTVESVLALYVSGDSCSMGASRLLGRSVRARPPHCRSHDLTSGLGLRFTTPRRARLRLSAPARRRLSCR